MIQKSKKRILFLGETYRADAITWIRGLEEFGDFEVLTWELKSASTGVSRIKRLLELFKTFFTINRIAKQFKPDMVIAERTTSYGFLASICGIKPIAIAQQGISDLWPENSPLYYLKKILQTIAFKKANIIHAWGPVMAEHMKKSNVPEEKILVLPKGINLNIFQYNEEKDFSKINAIVTRSLLPEYQHKVILEAFAEIKKENIPFSLTIVGDGILLDDLIKLSEELNIKEETTFTGRIHNDELPKLLMRSNFYISMPTTEGVSASLFEAMACGCFPIVSDLPGNRSWIKNHENGILIQCTDSKKLANEIINTEKNSNFQKKVIQQNRKFIEEHANYSVNMKIIADSYHQLINQKQQVK